jgi:DNA repair protein RadD
MTYTLRDYQQISSDAAIRFFRSTSKKNGLLVVPTGAGKSLIIADIAARLDGNVLVFQPSREILAQNFAKLQSYGVIDCSIYSASFNRKEIRRITFATIGSVMANMEDFNHFKYVIVDEAHVTNPKEGMYKEFFECADRKILGLTATPYRLCSSRDMNGEPKCILKFLTRTRPRIFSEVIYQVDISTLLQRGYLAKLRYFDLTILPPENIKRNTTGMDFDEDDLKLQMQFVDLQTHLTNIVRRLQNTKDGKPRKGILVFTKFLEESEALCKAIPGCEMVSGETPKKERNRILKEFQQGKINVLTNCGVLTTGYDYPELDTVVLARPTMSLALYYQIVGRAIRPHPQKESAWIVDLAGNIQRFGHVEDLHLTENSPGLYAVSSYTNGRIKQLTNVFF